jgi:hypothetical protein
MKVIFNQLSSKAEAEDSSDSRLRVLSWGSLARVWCRVAKAFWRRCVPHLRVCGRQLEEERGRRKGQERGDRFEEVGTCSRVGRGQRRERRTQTGTGTDVTASWRRDVAVYSQAEAR